MVSAAHGHLIGPVMQACPRSAMHEGRAMRTGARKGRNGGHESASGQNALLSLRLVAVPGRLRQAFLV